MRLDRDRVKDPSGQTVAAAVLGMLLFSVGIGMILGSLVVPDTFQPAGFVVGMIAGLLIYVSLWILFYYGRPTSLNG